MDTVLYGILHQSQWFCLAAFITLIGIGYLGSPLFVWTLAVFGLLWGLGAPVALIAVFVVAAIVFNVKPLRRLLVSGPLMKAMKDFMPKISATERVALDAGVVWVEGDLFSGKPDFGRILKEPFPELTEEEKKFLSGPVEELCAAAQDWEIWKTRNLSDKVWQIIKREKFWGMIIPKEYGGLGFSAYAHSEVIQKLASRNGVTAVTVMVPNSLGPAELIHHYGTPEQKKYWLPRLAEGLEIPAFALTEPTAGSDAGSILSNGVLFKDDSGKIMLKLNWNKRWITLASISTVLGLAFKLRDPQNLLGKGEDLGITCALIPTNTPGVNISRRHDPLGCNFHNCPTIGNDVIVSVDAIVGGVEGAGRGWQMLMECLAAGRGISLPAQSVGGSKKALRVTSAHAVIRKQFATPIGKFEGIEEPLSRIAGVNYVLESMRKFTLGAIDKGLKPPVITAMAKHYSTELFRKSSGDAMDIMGGCGISMGPRNLVGDLWAASPIGITVEGANILTRTLMIFGQGALRAHPYAFKEVDAIDKGDVKLFDWAFWGHVGHIVRNLFRAVVLSVSRGYLATSPVKGDLAKYYRRLTWASASFAIMADVTMGVLGGSLKQKQKITGRFADILAWMYMCTAVLRRFEAEGRKPEDLPFVKYGLKMGLSEIQYAFDGIFDNLKIPGLSWFVKGWLGAWSRINSLSSDITDNLSHALASAVQDNLELRDRHTQGVYIPKDSEEALGRLEKTLVMIKQSDVIEKKIRKAVKEKLIAKKKGSALLEEAKAKNVISPEEFTFVLETEKMRYNAVQVDDFSDEEYKKPLTTSGVLAFQKPL